MAPEEVFYLLALRLRLEGGKLLANGERVALPENAFYVTWYASAPTAGQVPIAGGLVQVRDDPHLFRDEVRNASPADMGEFCQWREPLTKYGDSMIAVSLPLETTLLEADPRPVEAKEFDGSIAVFWRLPPGTQVSLKWRLGKLIGDIRSEIQRINQEGMAQLVTAREGSYDYDVALSFAGEDRDYVEQVANALRAADVRVFYDRFEEAALWGKNLYDYLSDVYSNRARYTVMFISRHYAEKMWTSHERECAQARALEENLEYILPARFDDTRVPGLPSTVGYLSLHGREPENLAGLIVEKLRT